MVKKRKDGTLADGSEKYIVSLFFQSKQKCNCPINKDIAEELGVEIMVALAKRLAAGETKVEDLYAERNTALKTRGKAITRSLLLWAAPPRDFL